MNKAWLLGAALLCGCQTLAIADPAGLGTGEAIAATVPDALPFAVPAERAASFGALYDDPLLARYIQRALSENTDIDAARARLRGAEARLAQARARRSLTLSAGASAGVATALDDIDPIDNAGLNLGVGYDPDLFGGLRAGVRGEAARAAIAQFDLARLRRAIAARTAQSYIAVVAADARLALARENFEFLGETLRVSRARFEAGDIARADFALSEAEYENSRAALVDQELSARETRRALATLINAYADEALPVADALPRALGPGVGLREAADRAVLSRFDVEAARLGVVAAVADVDAVRASTLPSVSLSGSVAGGLKLSDLLDIDTYIARLTAGISDVLFDGGGETARIEGARASVDAALARFEAQARDAYRELVSGFDRVAVAEQRVRALQAASAAAETALELEQVRFDLGEAILLDVLTVQRRVNSIRGARISAEADLLQSLADAYLAAGPAQ